MIIPQYVCPRVEKVFLSVLCSSWAAVIASEAIHTLSQYVSQQVIQGGSLRSKKSPLKRGLFVYHRTAKKNGL